ncbi:hypothetical protein [Deinococcus sp.]|uniref:hypothetical protein n=1 Tax=Deinococcus sp. TaxID=47478 RepID=UPI0025FABAFB|nr:hypothetical protein [Deinococcus sp.]
MSLDVYLIDRQPACRGCGRPDTDTELFSASITHNLGQMATEAGIYDAVWRPDEHGYTHAAHIIGVLAVGIAVMRAEPERFEVLSAKNGWGTYTQFLPWLNEYMLACERNPAALIVVAR